MLGTRKTVPLWNQRKPNLLEQERALKSEALKAERTESERGVIEQQIVERRLGHAKAISNSARHRS